MLIDGQFLFPMAMLRHSFDGYYMNVQGAIFSNRGPSGKLRQLNGSRTTSGHYFTLNNSTWRHDQLMREAKAHAKFANHTTGITSEDRIMQKSVSSTADQVLNAIRDRHHAENVAQGVKQKGVVLATIVDGTLIFGSRPKIHLSDESWRAEAERIAVAKPGLKVVALKVVGSVVSGGVNWE